MTVMNREEEIAHLSRVVEAADLDIEDVILPRHLHVVLGNMRFHYTEWGERGKPAILFLHGGNQTAHTWDAVCLALSRDFHCVALDQRGHGESEWSYGHHYSPQDHAKDIEGLVEHLGWNWFVLVGMSMGCLNGMHFAARHCGKLAGFVAVDAGPFVQVEAASGIVSFVKDNVEHDSLEDFVSASLKFNPKRRPELLRHSLTRSVRQTSDGKWTWKSDRRRSLDIANMKDLMRELEDLVDHMTCPTLVMRGGESQVYSENSAERFAGKLADGRWVSVPGAGHTIQGDNPKQFVAELRTFLNELGRPWAA